MSSLQTDDLIALSLLINEDIYSLKDEETEKKLPETSIKTVETTQTEEVKPEQTPQKTFDYLGDNNKYILIVVKEASADFLTPPDLGFLLKILAAKKLELSDVAIINIEKIIAPNFDDLKNFFAFNKIITFGINPQLLHITGAVANKKSIFKEIPVLGTWDLQKLQADKSKKAVFWEELKNF